MLQAHNGESALMGGGTDLLPNIKHRLANPKYVIGLRSIAEMRNINHCADGCIRLGGAVTLSELEHSAIVRERYPALAEAASLISTPQVRRMGTVGGNICLDVRCNYYNQSEHWRRAVGYCMKKDSPICRVAPGSDRCWAVSSADTVPVLIVLDAQIRIAGTNGERYEPLGGFYRDDGLVPMTLAAGEIVDQVKIPPPSLSVIYSKLRIRLSFDFPLMGAATGLALDSDRTVRRARIVITAVGSHPLEVVEAERILEGNRLNEELIRAAGEKVFRAVHPLDNTEGSIPHRKRMARVYVERALRRLGGLEQRAA
jgi:4-hydroxybenzoyl-CoA reductase subunit beta